MGLREERSRVTRWKGGTMATLEIWGPTSRSVLELDGERITVGRSTGNAIVVCDDSSVSRQHALLERIGDVWFIRDVGSANGSTVNGQPLLNERALHNGDEFILGRTRFVFHDSIGTAEPSTSMKLARPKLTAKEHEVLVELCRPLMSGGAFRMPATVHQMAERMFVGRSAVQAHLGRLYDKFDIYEDGRDRRLDLANRAIETGSVSPRDYKDDSHLKA
jgi:pSer/pThr/pTyr-binding forkhead associated (FHA) protein